LPPLSTSRRTSMRPARADRADLESAAAILRARDDLDRKAGDRHGVCRRRKVDLERGVRAKGAASGVAVGAARRKGTFRRGGIELRRCRTRLLGRSEWASATAMRLLRTHVRWFVDALAARRVLPAVQVAASGADLVPSACGWLFAFARDGPDDRLFPSSEPVLAGRLRRASSRRAPTDLRFWHRSAPGFHRRAAPFRRYRVRIHRRR
jgi:hypothetical protein